MRKRKFPKRPAQFKRHCERIIAHCREKHPLMFQIDAFAALECEIALHYYYGGEWRTVWHLFKKCVRSTFLGFIFGLRLKICDWVGWTKVYHIPETKTMIEHWQRHGRKCSGSPNCNNDHCIEDSIPNWYRKLTFWDRFP